MKAIKTTMVVLMSLLFTFLLCCTILGWENLTTTEKKEFTQAEMLANYEQGRNDEKANTENTINELITKHSLEIISLNNQLDSINNQIITLTNEKLKLESQIEILENSNLNQKNTIQELNNQITILTNEKEELYSQIRELNNQVNSLTIEKGQVELENLDLKYELGSYKEFIQNGSSQLFTKVETYDTSGNSIAVDLKNYTSELILPSSLPDGTVVNEWIVEYKMLNPADWLNTSFVCEVLSAGTALNLYTSSLKLKAVVGEVYDVYFYLNNDTLLYQTKACENSKISYDFTLDSLYYLSAISEEINSTWNIKSAVNSNYKAYNINYNTKFLFGITQTLG